MVFHEFLFGCFDDTAQCGDTILCYPCQVSRQCSAVEGRSEAHDCSWCLIAFFCAPFMPCCLRCKVSDKYQLEEGACQSVVCGLCCGCCSVCQTGRELNYRGINPGGCCCRPKDSHFYGTAYGQSRYQ